MGRAERYFSGLLILVGAAGFIGGLSLPLANDMGGPGSGLLPRILSLLLIVLAGITGLTDVLRRSSPEKSKRFTQPGALRSQLIFGLLLIASVLLINVLGMLTSIGLFIILVMTIVEKVPLLKTVIMALVTILIVYFVFELWLGLVLPKGLLF